MFNNNTELEVRDKLIILMLINDIEVPLTNEEITDLVMNSELINYISLQHYITELHELSMLDKIPNKDKYYYFLTENGKVSLNFFKARIPQHTQKKIDNITMEYKKALPVKTNINSNFKNINDETIEITLSIKDNQNTNMSIKLNVMSNKHANLICKKWDEKASYLYGDILNLLTSNKK